MRIGSAFRALNPIVSRNLLAGALTGNPAAAASQLALRAVNAAGKAKGSKAKGTNKTNGNKGIDNLLKSILQQLKKLISAQKEATKAAATQMTQTTPATSTPVQSNATNTTTQATSTGSAPVGGRYGDLIGKLGDWSTQKDSLVDQLSKAKPGSPEAMKLNFQIQELQAHIEMIKNLVTNLLKQEADGNRAIVNNMRA